MAKEITEYTTYCGKPLVKNGNIICYGNPSKKAVLVLTVLTTKDFHGKEIPDMIFVQVQDTKTGEVLKSVTENHEFWEIPCFFQKVVIEYCLFERLAQLVRALR